VFRCKMCEDYPELKKLYDWITVCHWQIKRPTCLRYTDFKIFINSLFIILIKKICKAFGFFPLVRPHWLATFSVGRLVLMMWRQSARRRGNPRDSSPHSHRSIQTPPGKEGNAPVNILPARGGGGLTQGNLTS